MEINNRGKNVRDPRKLIVFSISWKIHPIFVIFNISIQYTVCQSNAVSQKMDATHYSSVNTSNVETFLSVVNIMVVREEKSEHRQSL